MKLLTLQTSTTSRPINKFLLLVSMTIHLPDATCTVIEHPRNVAKTVVQRAYNRYNHYYSIQHVDEIAVNLQSGATFVTDFTRFLNSSKEAKTRKRKMVKYYSMSNNAFVK